jgi:hypothetical protein
VTDPELVPRDALDGVDIGISVSDSADLAQLGLTTKHAELAIGEVARAVLVAGGRLTYGGRIKPSGFTQLLMHEVRRYGQDRRSFTICLALPEHRRLALSELDSVDRSLGVAGRLVCLDIDGSPVDPRSGRSDEGEELDDPDVRIPAYSGLRRFIASTTRGRVVVGGQLANFKGAIPGVIEEVIASIEARQPVYIAGGFGGAAALAARTLGIDSFEWAPDGFPQTPAADARVEQSLVQLAEVARRTEWVARDNGLTDAELLQLSASHRPGDIASLVAIGLGRRFGSSHTGGDGE